MPTRPPKHQQPKALAPVARHYDQMRGSAASRGYDSRWRKARVAYLAKHPLCECPDCALKIVTPSSVVDHVIPHRLSEALASGDEDAILRARALFWDSNNWCAMAKACHDRKTAKSDGGFGNRRKS